MFKVIDTRNKVARKIYAISNNEYRSFQPKFLYYDYKQKN